MIFSEIHQEHFPRLFQEFFLSVLQGVPVFYPKISPEFFRHFFRDYCRDYFQMFFSEFHLKNISGLLSRIPAVYSCDSIRDSAYFFSRNSSGFKNTIEGKLEGTPEGNSCKHAGGIS